MKFVDWLVSNIRSRWIIMIYIAIILSVSSLAVTYILPPLKIVLFGFIGTLGLLLSLLFFSSPKYVLVDTSSLSVRIDYVLIGCSLFTLLSSIVHLPLQELNLIISEVVLFFAIGWFIVRVLNIDKIVKTWLAVIAISFVISLGATSLVFSLTLSLNTQNDRVLISSIYVGISIGLLIMRSRYQDRMSIATFHERKINLTTLLLLIWIFLFFTFIITTLYPKLADIPGSDIVRHISDASELLNSPQLYTSEYPWFHFMTASTKSLSNAPDWLLHIGTGFLSLFLILTFYVMANRYLSDIDPRAPIMSTVFFFIFAGFGWLYFLANGTDLTRASDYFKAFSVTNLATYWDVGFGGSTWLWFWFRPLTVGFSILFVSIYLLRCHNIPKKGYIPLVAFIVVVLSQIHITELVMFVGILFASSLLAKATRLRINETLIGLVIGLGSSVVVSYSNPLILDSIYQAPQTTILIQLMVIAVLSFLVLRVPIRKITLPSLSVYLICAIGIFIYLVLLLSWLNTVDNTALQKISTVLAVPWEFYPVLLGVLGLLSIPGIVIALRKYKKHPIIIFVILFFLSVIFGRLVTYFNIEIGGLGYWERRTIPFALVSVSILSTLFLIAFTRIPMFRNATRTTIAKITVVSCLVLFGTFSTLLSIQFQSNNIAINAMTDKEETLQNSLENIGIEYTILTANSRASNIVEYYNPGYLIGYFKAQIWPSVSPELPLKVMSILDNNSAIYLNAEDDKRINKGGFVGSHLLRMGNSTNSNQEGLITLPRLVPPVPYSTSTLVLSDEQAKSDYYAYDILSTGGVNFTTAKISDIASLNKSDVLVAPTESIGSDLKKLKNDYNLKFHDLIVLNLDGYSELIKGTHGKSSLKIEGRKSQWNVSGINKGSIGVPQLTFDDNKLGDKQVSIRVSNGSYALWQISHKFASPINLSSYDVFNFEWYGKKDGKFYVIEFSTGDGSSFWYRFQDEWKGWKHVAIPLHQEDGRTKFFGVTMDIVSGNNTSWNNITTIKIRTEASNLNNLGSFYIKDMSFESKVNSSGIQLLPRGGTLKFPINIELLPTKYIGLPVLKALYENTTVPYLMAENNTNLNTLHVNIYPIINLMESDARFASTLFPELGALLLEDLPKYQSVSKDIRALVRGGVSAFRSFQGLGHVVAISDSSSLIPHSPSIKVSYDDKVVTLDGIQRVFPLSEDYSEISASNVTTIGGNGFYLSALLDHSSTSYYGNPARISLVSHDSENRVITGNNITVTVANTSIMLRQPTMNISGTMLLDDFYAYGDLNSKIRSLGNDIQIIGKMKFDVQTSDVFTVVQNTEVDGQVIRFPSLYTYDDVYNLSQLFDYNNIRHILAISVILIIIGIFFNNSRFRMPEAKTSNP